MTYLRCTIGPGVFRHERQIKIDVEGQIYRAIVDAGDVVESTENGQVLSVGLVRVTVVSESNDTVLVDLPRETFSAGIRIFVPPELLQQHAQ